MRQPPSEHHARAEAAYLQGRIGEAAREATAALRLTPNNPHQHYILGSSLSQLNNPDRALPHLLEADARAPDRPHVLCALANTYRLLDRRGDALTAAERALAAQPGWPPALALKSMIMRMSGQAAQAMALIEPLHRANPSEPALACEFADLCRALRRHEDGVAALQALDIPALTETYYRKSGWFKLGQLLDELGRYDEAFDAISRANAREKPPRVARAERVIDAWPRERVESLPQATRTGPVPVLVVGMPRSGTTLTERIIAAHPDAAGVGESLGLPTIATELEALGRPPTAGWMDAKARHYLASLARPDPAATHVVDKLPDNYANLGLASRLLPGVRIVHCRRDPRDVCLSCYFQDFSRTLGYSEDLVACAKQYKAHLRIMEHWRDTLDLPVFELAYEVLIADPEPTVRSLLEFLGLGFDEACLSFHRSAGHVRTASWAQVTRPLYTSSVGKWKHYERHLGPMLAELGLAAEPSA